MSKRRKRWKRLLEAHERRKAEKEKKNTILTPAEASAGMLAIVNEHILHMRLCGMKTKEIQAVVDAVFWGLGGWK